MNEAQGQKKTYRFTIRFGILAVFISVFAVLALFILFVISHRFYQNSLYLTKQVTANIAANVAGQTRNELRPARNGSAFSAMLIQDNLLDSASYQHLATYTKNLLETAPRAQMAYYGDEQGNFVISRRQSDGSISTEVIDRRAQPAKRWTIVRDKQGNVIATKPIQNLDYDPRKRPWYQTAKNNGTVSWTPIYVFYSGDKKTLGITSVAPVFRNQKLDGVFGIDMNLVAISRFLKNLKISENGIAFIVDADEGQMIAYPHYKEKLLTVDNINQPHLQKAFEIYKRDRKSHFYFEAHGQAYFVSALLMPRFIKDNWVNFIIVPENDVLGPIWRANLYTLAYCGIILFIGFLLISFFSRRISNPIKALANDLDRVKNLDIDNTVAIESRVREVHLMSRAIQTTKIGLRSFEKYVPAALVRILISQGKAAKIGGTLTPATLFFSDIEDFTAVSEKVGDESIMTQMCEYFDALTKIVRGNHGTIDKFIGDSLMAFWGAPVQDDNHIEHGCESALWVHDKITELNVHWASIGKIPFPTRIGMHSGDVIIGNLGARDRLNYTAIGDNVNVASRLERLNKVYGTSIIVSEAIYDAVSDKFIMRRLDKVVVKGRKQSHFIFELCATNTSENQSIHNPKIAAYESGLEAYIKHAFKEAILYFEQVLSIDENDKAAEVMIERCQINQKNGVPDDWDGVWIYKEK